MKDKCTCNSQWGWENGPCDYCTTPWCGFCDHEFGHCPDDCICECNENTTDEETS